MKPEVLGAFIVGGIATVGAIVLSATGHPVPAELWTLAGAAFGGGLGLAPGTSPTTTTLSAPAPVTPATATTGPAPSQTSPAVPTPAPAPTIPVLSAGAS